MKTCPTCHLKYADDTFEFCLHDGTSLVDTSLSETPTVLLGETETIARNFPLDAAEKQNWQQNQAAPPGSRTGMIILLTALGMFLIFGSVAAAWFYFNDRPSDLTQKNANSPNAAIPKVNGNFSNSANSANVSRANTKPISDFDPEQVKTEISDVIYTWKSQSESRKLDAHMDNYADKVDYYKRRGASRDFIREDKQKYLAQYDSSIKSDFSNMTITPGETGETATAVFDKEWISQGANNYSDGKVQMRLEFVKAGGRWLIRSENTSKIYYVRK